MKQNRIWVVEMFDSYAKTYDTTIGIALSREEAEAEKQRWLQRNPDDKFRVRAYVAR